MTIGILLVSHSRKVARAVIELARQLAPEVPMLGVGGDLEGGFGANAGEVIAACDELSRICEHVMVIADLGSSNLAVDAAIDYRRLFGKADNVSIGRGPFLEGAIAASVAARGGGSLEQVREAIGRARSSWDARLLPIVGERGVRPGHHAGMKPSGASAAAGRAVFPDLRKYRTPVLPARLASGRSSACPVPEAGPRSQGRGRPTAAGKPAVSWRRGETGFLADDDEFATETSAFHTREAVVVDAAGLHARPAAMLATLAAGLGSDVFVDGMPATSMMEMMLLDVEQGDTVVVSGESVADVEKVAEAISRGFDSL